MPARFAGPSLELWFVDEAGTQRREPLSSCWQVPFEGARPSRAFPSFKGQRSFPGLWWSATTDEHVGYESWVERDAVGWEFRRTGEPSDVLAANLRWLAGYRHPRCHRPEIADALLEVFVEPASLLAGAAAVGDRLAVLPACYHLLWRQVLVTDLAAAPLSPGSLLQAQTEGAAR